MTTHHKTLSFQDSHGQAVSGILAKPSPRTDQIVVLCHGFLSNKQSNTNRRLTELLTERGISTFAFDWFGMGESDGRFADLTVDICCDALEHALSFVRSRDYSRVGLVGSSYGGLIATLIAARDSNLAALGLKCPVPDFPEMLRVEFGQEAMNRWQNTGEIPDVTGSEKPIELRYAFYENCLTYDTYTAAQAVTTPTIIVHGDGDELVPIHQITRLKHSLSGETELRLLPGANHHFGKPDDFRIMTTCLANWMIQHLPD
ncbi:alpha/beta hydrolase family protein [Nitrospira sp. M1]